MRTKVARRRNPCDFWKPCEFFSLLFHFHFFPFLFFFLISNCYFLLFLHSKSFWHPSSSFSSSSSSSSSSSFSSSSFSSSFSSSSFYSSSSSSSSSSFSSSFLPPSPLTHSLLSSSSSSSSSFFTPLMAVVRITKGFLQPPERDAKETSWEFKIRDSKKDSIQIKFKYW